MLNQNLLQNFVADNSVLFWAIILWTIVWKGLALWKAARNEQKPWFVVLLIVNTLGVLEIFYLFVFSKWKKSASSKDEA